VLSAPTIAATVLLVGGGTVGWAYFTAGGSGSGSGSTATTVAVTISPGTPTAALAPGQTSDVELSVSNPNAAELRLGSLVLDTTQGDGGFAVDAGHASCTLTSLTYTTQDNGGSGWTLPPRVGATNGTLAITLASAVAMASDAPNACQGATFTVYLAAS